MEILSSFLNNQITIIRPVSTKGSFHQIEKTGYAHVCKTWAGVKYDGGGQNNSDMVVSNSYDITFYIRKTILIKQEYVIQYNNENFDIVYIEPTGTFSAGYAIRAKRSMTNGSR